MKEITDYAAGQEDVLLLTSYAGLGNLELGALNQHLARGAPAVAARGLRPRASEALWKGTPVVGGRERRPAAPGARRGGRLPHRGGRRRRPRGSWSWSRDPGLAIEMGHAGRERVRERFLVTRVLEDELRLLRRCARATVPPR